MRGKTATFGGRKSIFYDSDHWNLLSEKRKRAIEVLNKLSEVSAVVYGSVARGDVTESSDVDIFVSNSVPSYRLEVALDSFNILERRIVQATPNYAIKGEFVLDDNTTVSFPLVKIKERELEFYRFGGAIDFIRLKKDKRVAGVDKRLVLILPHDRGHDEIPLNELQTSELSRILDVSVEIIDERIRVLERRREVGRTGVFMFEPVPPFESFESTLREVARRNPIVKRRLNG
jgi:hypothetical protein